jgi:hypothetical protein
VLSGDRFGDIVLAAAFGVEKTRRLRLFSAYSKRIHTVEQARFATRAAASLMILGLLIYSIHGLSSLISISGKNGDVLRDQKTKEAETAEIAKELEALPVHVDEVVDMMFFYEMLSERPYSILDMVRQLHGAVTDDALLASMTWSASNIINPLQDPASGQKLSVTLDFELAYREKSWPEFEKKMHGFLDALKKLFPSYEVTHGTLPGTLETTDNLQVNFEDAAAQNSGPEQGQTFTVSVTLAGPKPPSDPQQPPPQDMGAL